MTGDPVTLRCEELVRYSCGEYEIEVGPGDYWCWRKQPDGVQTTGLADLRALAAVSTAAATYLSSMMADVAPEPEVKR